MQPHRVYLANSSGLKVGITRAGRELGRWLDQGAIQGMVILEADTRRAAGLAEVRIATRLKDRTDWRKMLRADVPELDLERALVATDRNGPGTAGRRPRRRYPAACAAAVSACRHDAARGRLAARSERLKRRSVPQYVRQSERHEGSVSAARPGCLQRQSACGLWRGGRARGTAGRAGERRTAGPVRLIVTLKKRLRETIE